MSDSSREDRKYQPEGNRAASAAAIYSTELSETRLRELEAQLKVSPDLEPRLLLLGHFMQKKYTAKGREKNIASLKYGEHIQWMVTQHPRHIVHTICSAHSDDEHFLETKTQWENQVRLNPNDVTVLYHASRFTWLERPLEAVRFLQRASTLDDSDDLFPADLCDIYIWLFDNSKKLDDREEFAKLALQQLKEAIVRYESFSRDEKRKLFTYKYDLKAKEVAALAISCKLDSEARRIGKLVLNRTKNLRIPNVLPNVKAGEAYGMISSINTGNSILGQVALAEGNTALALSHFQKLLVIEPYHHVEANFATSLLEGGEHQAVAQYLQRVRELWANRVKAGKTNLKHSAETERRQNYSVSRLRKLNLWIRKIENGQIPNLSWS